MPEGDTIHRLANVLRPQLVDKRVLELRIRRAEFALGAFEGAVVTKVEALGKHLLIHFDNSFTLHAHLGMTGVVHCYGHGEMRRRNPQNVAFSLQVEGAEVVGYRVPRVRVLRTNAIATDPVLAAVGQDLLAANVSLALAVASLRVLDETPIGAAVMDQRVVAGIGNVYKSEILFRLKLDPFAKVAAFTDEQLSMVVDEARMLLRFNVDQAGVSGHRRVTRFDGVSSRRKVSVYGRKDEPCFDCGARIDMRRQGTALRSTYFCPSCQHCEYVLVSRGPKAVS